MRHAESAEQAQKWLALNPYPLIAALQAVKSSFSFHVASSDVRVGPCNVTPPPASWPYLSSRRLLLLPEREAQPRRVAVSEQ